MQIATLVSIGVACCLYGGQAFSLVFEGTDQLTSEEKGWLVKQSLPPKKLLPFLHAMGYYHPRIESAPTSDGSKAKLILGPPTLIRQAIVEILEKENQPSHDPELLKLLKDLPFKPGGRLSETRYEQFKQALLSQALQSGYLQAKYLRSEIEVCLRDKTAAIHLTLYTGPQHFFGPVTFMSPPYPPAYLKKYTPFSLGERYSVQKLLTYQKVLTEADLFTKVSIEPQQ